MVVLIVVLAVPSSLCVAGCLYRRYRGVAELLTATPVRAGAASRAAAGGEGGAGRKPVVDGDGRTQFDLPAGLGDRTGPKPASGAAAGIGPVMGAARESEPVMGAAAGIEPTTGAPARIEPTPVRITAVIVLDRSLLVAVTPHGMGSDADLGEDQVLLGELFEPDGGAAVAVLNRWQATGTPVVMELGSNRLTFQA